MAYPTMLCHRAGAKGERGPTVWARGVGVGVGGRSSPNPTPPPASRAHRGMEAKGENKLYERIMQVATVGHSLSITT